MKFWLVSAAVSGFLSVVLGAFGAHSIRNVLSEYGRSTYEKAILYQMFHTFGLFGVGLLQGIFKEVDFSPAGYGFMAGIILFSGSLYVLSVTGIKWLGAITPAGGVAFLFGWAWLIFSISRTRS
ncbi:MAG: DUF423 domain-containing protein [Deltaproteobacteria bacterium]|nr:MAG: DUF423 domain-containing protein [Deltaproteobacteria bacterium]